MRVTIVGLGLMGGSLAMGLKQKNACREVTALVRRVEAVEKAAGVVDFASTDPAQILPQADLVVFSTPVRAVVQQVSQWAALYQPGVIITDMGSTKQAVVQAMASLPPQVYPLGSHPMCGKEQAGLAAAEAALFEGAPWIITPLERTPPAAIRLVTELAEAVGARVRLLAADRHDKLVAAISHLPYAMSAALVLAAQNIASDDPVVWEVAATGFRDASRLAASDVTMMLDILLTNQAAVSQMITQAQAQLGQLAQALAASDEVSLQKLLEQAATQRQQLYQQSSRVAK
jgi:prephenate dehydrogenase